MINSYNLNKKTCIYVDDHSNDCIAANAANTSFFESNLLLTIGPKK